MRTDQKQRFQLQADVQRDGRLLGRVPSSVRFWSWTSDSGTHRVILRTSRGVQLVRRELEGGGHPDQLLGSHCKVAS